jgi:signal transduction histidine kinase
VPLGPPAPAALSSGEAQAFRLFDYFPLAVVGYTAEGKVSFINAAASRLLGVAQDRAPGRTVLEVLRRHTLEELCRSGGELELEFAGRQLHCTAAGGLLWAEDRTEAASREHDLRESMAVLSHELRTPVAAVLGILEALQFDMDPATQQSFVAQAAEETRRLARLIDEIAAGFRPSLYSSFPLRELRPRLERLLGEELQQSSSALAWEGLDVEVWADRDKLLQVLLNLLQNAIRYGPPGSTVRLAARLSAGAVHIEVADPGNRLSDYRGIFLPHQRGPGSRGPGSGMGLYIVRSIARSWGGDAGGLHRDGVGNVFWVEIPDQAALHPAGTSRGGG